MPPRQKISKEMITQTAFMLLKEQGIGEVTVRAIAKKLGCSTQPIYSYFENMEMLRVDLVQAVEAYHAKYMLETTNESNPFLNMGLNYIRFAEEEKYLFQLLFLSNELHVNNFMELFEEEENKMIFQQISLMTTLSEDDSKNAFLHVWLTTHAIATIQATNETKLTLEEIEKILMDSFMSIVSYYKQIKGEK